MFHVEQNKKRNNVSRETNYKIKSDLKRSK